MSRLVSRALVTLNTSRFGHNVALIDPPLRPFTTPPLNIVTVVARLGSTAIRFSEDIRLMPVPAYDQSEPTGIEVMLYQNESFVEGVVGVDVEVEVGVVVGVLVSVGVVVGVVVGVLVEVGVVVGVVVGVLVGVGTTNAPEVGAVRGVPADANPAITEPVLK